MNDPKIVHWELKHVSAFKDYIYFRVNTIRLINGKYETAVVPCDPEGKMMGLYIHFYNRHSTKDEAVEFHILAASRLDHIGKTYTGPNEDIVDYINKNVEELTVYPYSVPYSYPEDIFGETYR